MHVGPNEASVASQTALSLLRQQEKLNYGSANIQQPPPTLSTNLRLLLPSNSSSSNSGATIRSKSSNDVLRLYNGITELVGEAGSGKSQIAMSLCLSTVLPSSPWQGISLLPSIQLSNRAIYIWTGTSHSISTILHRRLRQMIQYRLHSSSPQRRDTTSSKLEELILSKIFIKSISTVDQLQDLLGLRQTYNSNNTYSSTSTAQMGELEKFIQQESSSSSQVKLVVLDSIGGLFRTVEEDQERDASFLRRRSTILFQCASVLKRLSDMYNFPVVVTNQISASVTSNLPLGTTTPTLTYGQPALGLSWSNCVNTRYWIIKQDIIPSRDTEQPNVTPKNNPATSLRYLTLQLSSRLPATFPKNLSDYNHKSLLNTQRQEIGEMLCFQITVDGVHEL